MQFATVTKTTDANGYFTYVFPEPVDSVMASVNSPEAGTNKGVISAAATLAADKKTVKVRVWVTAVNWTAHMAVKTKVTVTLLGLTSDVTPPPPPPPPSDAKYTLSALDRSQTPNMDDPSIKGGDNDSGVCVRQEVWNPDASALKKQLTEVWSGSNWQTTVNAVKGNTAVNSYPDVSNTVTSTENTPVPASSYASLVSTYAESMEVNADTDAEAAYDIWLGTSEADQYSRELMIWVENHGQTPAGDPSGAPVTIAGHEYQLWADGNDTLSFVMTTNTPSGTVDILAIVNWLIAQGRYPANIGFNQINFGFEIPSTGGVDSVFKVTGYTLAYTMK